MAGDFLLKLKDLNVFRPNVMDTIMNEFEPEEDIFRMTQTFLPFREVDSLDMIDMVQYGAFGKTYPVRLGADHMRIDLPGVAYKQYGAAHWREGVIFNEETLLRAINPQAPMQRIGEGLVTQSLNLLDLRLNNLIEQITIDTIIRGYYTENRWDTNYTFNPNIPKMRYIDITASSGDHKCPWMTGATSKCWDETTTATPLADIKNAVVYFRKIGYETKRIHMNDITALKIEATKEWTDKVALVPALIMRSIMDENFMSMIAGIKGQTITVDSRIYHEETRVAQIAAATDTAIYVEDSSQFHNADDVIIHTSNQQEFVRTLGQEPSANVITLPAALGVALAVGDRIVALRKRLPTDYLILEGQKATRTSSNNWLSTPSLVKNASIGNPQPGRYTWRHFATDRPPYNLEVGAGISGGPKIGEANWLVVKVTNTSDGISENWL